MLRGSCLCGEVQYTVDGAPLLMVNCHCSMCRKAHGGAYTTFLKIARKDFRINAGEKHIVAYQSSPEVTRSFCRLCGGKFTFDWARAPEYLWLAAGGLDGDPGITPSCHIFVGSKADWFQISDTLPQYDAYPPADL